MSEGDADLQRCHRRGGMLARWADNDAIEGRDKAGRQAALVASHEKLEIVVTERARRGGEGDRAEARWGEKR